MAVVFPASLLDQKTTTDKVKSIKQCYLILAVHRKSLESSIAREKQEWQWVNTICCAETNAARLERWQWAAFPTGLGLQPQFAMVTDSHIGAVSAYFCLAEPRISQSHTVYLTTWLLQTQPRELDRILTLSHQQENWSGTPKGGNAVLGHIGTSVTPTPAAGSHV